VGIKNSALEPAESILYSIHNTPQVIHLLFGQKSHDPEYLLNFWTLISEYNTRGLTPCFSNCALFVEWLKINCLKEDQFILVKGRIHQKEITIVNLNMLNINAPNFIKHILLNLKTQRPQHSVVGDFSTTLSPTDRSSRQKK
jgi:hypothetical protein